MTKQLKTVNKESIKNTQSFTQKFSPVFLPIGVSVLAFALIFLFVLKPTEPDAVLKKAFINTFDPSKVTSARYSGTYGVKEENIAVEFSGQVNGDQSSSLVSIDYDKARSSVEQVTMNTSYIKMVGSDNFNIYVQSLSDGKHSIDPVALEVLPFIEGKWLNVSKTDVSALSIWAGCDVPVSQMMTKTDFTDFMAKFPLKVTEGPYADDGDNSILKMTVQLDDPEHIAQVPGYTKLQAFTSCLSKIRSKDFKTRDVNTQDVSSIKIEVYINQSTTVIEKIIIRQFDTYFQIFFKDQNKDVTIKAPEGSLTLQQILLSMPDDTKTKLLKSMGL